MGKYTKEERQGMDAKIPKCKCGNNLSLIRQENGITNCPSCDSKADVIYDRKKILLKAVVDILEKLDDSTYVLSFFEQIAFYDDAECDGSCLLEDIKIELDMDE